MTDISPNRPADPAVEAAARGRVVGKRDRHVKVKQKAHDRPQVRTPPASPGAAARASSTPEFGGVPGGMSKAFFHALVARGKGPKLMKVGARTFITVEAAAEWRRAQEEATAQEN